MGFIMTFSCMYFEHVQPLHLLNSFLSSPSSYWPSCFHDPVSSIRIAYDTRKGYLHEHRLRGYGTKENVSASLTTISCLYKSSGRHETLRPPTYDRMLAGPAAHRGEGLWIPSCCLAVKNAAFISCPEDSIPQYSTLPPTLTFFPPAASAVFSRWRRRLHGYLSSVYMLQGENYHP